MLDRQLVDRVAQRACDGGARTFGSVSGATDATAQADSACEFGDEVLAVSLGLVHSSEVVQLRAFGDVVVNLGEPPLVRRARSRVEHGYAVGWPSGAQRARFDADQVEHVELASGFAGHPPDVPQTLEIFDV